jgi:alpha/beta superfamily hydrolase
MSERMSFLGVAAALLCLAAIIGGCISGGSASEVEETQPAALAPAETAGPVVAAATAAPTAAPTNTTAPTAAPTTVPTEPPAPTAAPTMVLTDTSTPTAAPTITPTPTPAIHRESIQAAYDDRVIRGTLVGEGEIAVVLAPGWTDTRAVWMGFARELAAAGYTAVAFDFPGAGASQGRVSFSLVGSDTAAVVDFLLARGHEQVVCMAASDGAGGCLGAAVAHPNLAGFVLLSSPVEATEEEAAGLLMPKLLVTGNEPEIIKATTELLRLLPEPKQYVKINTSRHGTDILGSDRVEELRDLLMTFLESIQ